MDIFSFIQHSDNHINLRDREDGMAEILFEGYVFDRGHNRFFKIARHPDGTYWRKYWDDTIDLPERHWAWMPCDANFIVKCLLQAEEAGYIIV